MKLRKTMTLAALASLMALPFAVNAQSRDRHNDQRNDRSTQGQRWNRGNDSNRNQSQDQRRQDQQRQDQQHREDQQRLDQQRRQDQARQDQQRRQSQQWQEAERRRVEQQRLQDQRYLQEQQRIEQLNRANQQRRWEDQHRYDGYRSGSSNQWRDIATASGFLGILGLLEHDNTLFFAGTAGALYSLNRYEQDRNSDDRLCRARAEFFSRDSFDRDGRHYERRTVNRNGQRYYQFVCND